MSVTSVFIEPNDSILSCLTVTGVWAWPSSGEVSEELLADWIVGVRTPTETEIKGSLQLHTTQVT